MSNCPNTGWMNNHATHIFIVCLRRVQYRVRMVTYIYCILRVSLVRLFADCDTQNQVCCSIEFSTCSTVALCYYADSDITRLVVDPNFRPPGENAKWACLNLLRIALTILKFVLRCRRQQSLTSLLRFVCKLRLA